MAANIHGNEKTFLNVHLKLAEKFLIPGSEWNKFLNHISIIIVPTMNPDGLKKNTRKNAQHLDLNRDFVKLEAPETRYFLKNIIQKFNPLVWIDGHNGGKRPYNVQYLCSTHAATSNSLKMICQKELFKIIDKNILDHGYKSMYYGRGYKTHFKVGGPEIGKARNYGGIVNILTILLESPLWQSREAGIKSARIAMRSIFRYIVQNIVKIKSATMETNMSNIPVDFDFISSQKIDYSFYKNQELVEVTKGQLLDKAVSIAERKLPSSYYILSTKFQRAINILKLHKIKYEKIKPPIFLPVHQYEIKSIKRKSSANHKRAVQIVAQTSAKLFFKIFVNEQVFVPSQQNKLRLLAILLEPEADNGLFFWNFFDEALPRLPIYKFL